MILGFEFELTDHRVGVIVTAVSLVNVAVTLRSARRATEVNWVRSEVRPAVATFLTRHDTARVELEELLRHAAAVVGMGPLTIADDTGIPPGRVSDRLVAEIRHAHAAIELVAPQNIVDEATVMLEGVRDLAIVVDWILARVAALLATTHPTLVAGRRARLTDALGEAREAQEGMTARTDTARTELVALVRRLVRAEAPWWRTLGRLR